MILNTINVGKPPVKVYRYIVRTSYAMYVCVSEICENLCLSELLKNMRVQCIQGKRIYVISKLSSTLDSPSYRYHHSSS